MKGESCKTVFTVRSQFCFKHMCNSVKRQEKCQYVNTGDLVRWNLKLFLFSSLYFFNFPNFCNKRVALQLKKNSVIFKASTSVCTVLPRLCENLYIYKKKKGLETRVPRGTLSRPGRRCEILRFLIFICIFICILLAFPNSLLSGCSVSCLGKGEKRENC